MEKMQVIHLVFNYMNLQKSGVQPKKISLYYD